MSVRVEQDHPLLLLENSGWDPRIEVVEVGGFVRSHILYTARFTVVYDTLLGPLSGAWLAARAQERGGERPLLVIVSHSDWDHYWGNQCFEHAPILGLELSAQRIGGDFGTAELAQKKAEHPSYAAVRLVPPNLRLSGESSIDCGDLTLQLLHTRGHRPDHLALYIPEIKTLLPGDAVETPFALLDEADPAQDLADMRAALERLAGLEVDWLLPNHAPPQPGNELVRQNLEYYRELRRQTEQARDLAALEAAFPYSGPATADFYRQDHGRILRASWAARDLQPSTVSR